MTAGGPVPVSAIPFTVAPWVARMTGAAAVGVDHRRELLDWPDAKIMGVHGDEGGDGEDDGDERRCCGRLVATRRQKSGFLSLLSVYSAV